MRDIKFRGKRIDNGEWVHGHLIEDCYIVGSVVEWTEDYFNTEFWYKVDPKTVGQYTGLKDVEQFETPKELYTSDIVKMHHFLFDGIEYENEIVGVLEYDEELACVCLTKIKHDEIKKYMWYDNQEEFEHEKIPVCTIIGLHESSWTYFGNRLDNPELLGEVRE